MAKLSAHKNKGFTLIDSLIALVLFGTVIGLYYKQQGDIAISKTGKFFG